MSYLIPADYLKTIQDANLLQIINSNRSIQTAAELSAQAEVISMLKQKYETASEFTDTSKWVKANPYSAGDRVYLDADTYSAAATYAIGALVVYSGVVYSANVAISAPEAFTIAHWDLKGNQYDIFYALYPFPMFDLYAVYAVGDRVYWRGNQYTCLIETPSLSHDTALQYRDTVNLPELNVFPNNVANGATYWKNDGAYLVPGDTDILQASIWSPSDNRDKQMVEKLIDVTLYHLHSRISPRNIPALREVRYMGNVDDRVMKNSGEIAYPIYCALGWLQGCARGSVTPNLPKLQPSKGKRIRYGGNIRNINSY